MWAYCLFLVEPSHGHLSLDASRIESYLILPQATPCIAIPESIGAHQHSVGGQLTMRNKKKRYMYRCRVHHWRHQRVSNEGFMTQIHSGSRRGSGRSRRWIHCRISHGAETCSNSTYGDDNKALGAADTKNRVRYESCQLEPLQAWLHLSGSLHGHI